MYENTKEITGRLLQNRKWKWTCKGFSEGLSSDDKKSVGADIMAIEMSWPVGYPKVRKMDTDLWEVRTSISDKRICRIFFTVSGKKMILLHAIIKKSQKTPLEDLELAKTRKKLVLGGKKWIMNM